MSACRACGVVDHPSGCAQDLPAIAAAARTTCPDCPHPTSEHFSEDGVGCLHVILDLSTPGIVLHREFCPCTQPGTSAADQ